MRSCCAEPSEGVGVREAKRSSLSARCGRWLSTHLQRFCPCFPRSPEREHESTVNGSEVPKRTAPRTGERRKWRRCTSRVDPAINISRSTPEFTLPPEDADQPTTGQRPPRSRPESVTGDALMASSCNRGHDKRPEEDLKMPKPHPGIRRARRHAWEPAHVPSVLHGIQPSSIPEGRVLHHLVQEEHLGPTVAELEEPRQMQLAPEAQGGPDSSLEPVEDPCETPVLELRPVSPASGPAEPQNIPAVASALVPGPELEPHEPSGTVPGVLPRMALILAEPEPCPESISPCGVNTWDIPGVVSCPELESDVPSECSRPTPSPGMRLAGCHTWEPKHVPSVLHGSQLSSIPEGRVLHHLVQEEHVGPTVAEMEEPRQMQMAPEAQGGPDSSLEPVEDPRETPVLELRPVSPASGPAEPEDVPAVAATPVPGPELQPHEPSGMVPGPLDGMAPGLAEPEAVLEPTSPCAVNTWDVPREEEPTILAFPPRLVAEQLTLMCAVLFTEVAYAECQAYFWHQSQMGGLELLAPTIHRIIRQCGDTANLVTSSCLGAPSMTSRDRARVVKFWIQVAKECLALKNFASLRAILLALQSPAVRRLESTWRHVPWKSSRIYKNLKKRDKGINRKWLLEEAKSIATKLLWATRGSQGRKQQVAQGMVPFLGLFLDDLLVDKLPEHNEDGDKTSKRVLSVVPHKVTLVLGEILMHKRMAALYYLEPDEHFFKSFFQAVEPMDEEESYSLSCQLEPPRQRAGRKGLFFFRSHKS